MEIAPRARRIAPRQALADFVYDELLVALVDGELEPDSALNIDALSRDFGVSQTPIREALARLESTGLVRRAAHRGYRASPVFSTDEIAQLMDTRLVIEPANAARASERVTDELIERLAESIHDLREAPRGSSFSSFRSYWEADERLHRLIAEATGNPFLVSAYNAIGGQIHRFRLFVGSGVTDADNAILEHTSVLEAIQSGNPELAQRTMASHIEAVRARAIAEAGARG